MDDVLSIQEWIKNFKTCWNHHKKETKVERRKIEGIEWIHVIISIYKEMSQETPCFYKDGKQEGKTGPKEKVKGCWM
jgi:hypothetical protein